VAHLSWIGVRPVIAAWMILVSEFVVGSCGAWGVSPNLHGLERMSDGHGSTGGYTTSKEGSVSRSAVIPVMARHTLLHTLW